MRRYPRSKHLGVSSPAHTRQGVILILVVVVVAAFSVAAYSYTRLMSTEFEIASSQHKLRQQRLLAESALEQLLSVKPHSLATYCRPPAPARDRLTNRFMQDPAMVGRLTSTLQPSFQGTYAILTDVPRPNVPTGFGLNNESAKLNLNDFSQRAIERKKVIAKLMRYDGLNEATARGISDFLGIFEPERVTRSAMPSLSHDGSLTSLDQLLEVAGVTKENLFGEDHNGNGRLDPNENDGDESYPPDNADGKLQAGWSGHWTLIGAESNLRDDGSPKVNLNQTDLVALYDSLLDFATPEQARFVVAWRIASVTYTDESSSGDSLTSENIQEERKQTAQDRVRKQLGGGSGEAASDQPTPSSVTTTNPERINIATNRSGTMRSGIELGGGGGRRFRSLLALASCQLQLIINGEDTILVSPFPNDPDGLAGWLPRWERMTTTTDGPSRTDRINIMQASRETLTTIDGITPEVADQIVTARTRIAMQTGEAEFASLTVGWLLEAGLMRTSELRGIAAEITVGGGVFTGIAMGQLDDGHTASAIEFEIDALRRSPRLRRMLDLPPLSNQQRLPSGTSR